MMSRPATSAFWMGKRCPLLHRYVCQSMEKDRILHTPVAVIRRGSYRHSSGAISTTASGGGAYSTIRSDRQVLYQDRIPHNFSTYHYFQLLLQSPTTTTTTTTTKMTTSRTFSSSRHNKYKKKLPKGQKDPFKVLKVQRKTPYAQVKRMFLQIAMQHHPDTGRDKTEDEQNVSREIFIAARQAFEMIVEDPETDGICLRIELPDYVPDEQHADMDAWFKEQTGHDMPFMDEETMKEVAKMTESVGGGGMDRGLDRDGGMWDLARMVTRAVKSGGDGKNLLKLEAGEVKDPSVSGNLRAKRRRR